MPATETVAEADRVMTICNACRYCEGHCAVFPAMTRRLDFTAADLTYMAHLCHNCGSCYHHCQYAPPHEFAVDVPQALARLRTETYADFAWPPALAGAFRRNGLVTGLALAACLAAILVAAYLLAGPEALLGRHEGPGAFYAVIPHGVMVALFGGVSLFVVLALYMGLRRFHAAVGPEAEPGGGLPKALHDAFTLRYLDGGAGDGCTYPDETPSLARRRFHHLTFYGFLLCFASTCVATLYHYLLGLEAPYAWTSLPVVLGTVGGIGLLVGPAGLWWLKRRAAPAIADRTGGGADVALVALLFLTSLTGLLLLVFRGTPAMGLLLAVHLGVVLALFVNIPYGKLVHAVYRVAALARYARETRRAKKKAAGQSAAA